MRDGRDVAEDTDRAASTRDGVKAGQVHVEVSTGRAARDQIPENATAVSARPPR